MVDLMYYPTDLLFFDIPLLYSYVSLRVSAICSPFSVDRYLSLGIFLTSQIFSILFVSISELFCG